MTIFNALQNSGIITVIFNRINTRVGYIRKRTFWRTRGYGEELTTATLHISQIAQKRRESNSSLKFNYINATILALSLGQFSETGPLNFGHVQVNRSDPYLKAMASQACLAKQKHHSMDIMPQQIS
jgi:hypothetical protein